MRKKEVLTQVTQYKVTEISTVTDEVIEQVLNEWISKGWLFDQIQFVVREASRRPSMAFVFFVRPAVKDNPKSSYEKNRYRHPDDPEKPSGPEKLEETGCKENQ